MSARDAHHTAAAAKICWVDWLPGDGTAYRVYAPVIAGGPDRSDRLLLLNCVGKTVAFQFSLTEYRHHELGRWTMVKAKQQGIQDWAWRAAEPLLAAYGVTQRTLRPAGLNALEAASISMGQVNVANVHDIAIGASRPVVDIPLPGGAT